MFYSNPCWYVIYTRPRHEKKVAVALAGMAVDHFLPTVKSFRIAGGRRKPVLLPLFPSYIFVRPGGVKTYLDTLGIPGVLHYVKTGKNISEIRADIVDNLKAIGVSDDDRLTICTQHFPPGKTTMITAGPFAGFNCEVVQYQGKHKILVRVSLLQRNILLDISEANFSVRSIA